MFRLTLRAATAAAMLAAATPAYALDPSVIPTTAAPAIVPGTTRVADTWQLVNRGSASATLIAPRWVLSADHSSVPIGATYTTPYGSATVTDKFEPPCGYECGGVDLTLHLLGAPIAAPTFPKLLAEYPSPAVASSLPGSVLHSGFGGAPGNVPTVGWTTPAGGPAAGAATAPLAIGGDSGGASYWYPTATAAPVLTSILVWGLTPSVSNQQTVAKITDDPTEDAGGWMESVFAQFPTTPAPQFTSIADAIGPVGSLRPAPVSGVALAANGTTSVKIRWTNPATGSVPRTGARILVNGVQKMTVSASATTATVTGLKRLTNYTVRVVSTNANGDAAAVAGDSVSFKTRWLW